MCFCDITNENCLASFEARISCHLNQDVITKWIDHQQRSFFNPWERQMETGLILVFTGDEVYYSNPAIGQVLRAIGRNMNVCIIDFVAGDRNDWIGSCSEKVRDMVEVHHFNNGLGPEEKNPRRQWEKARELINSGKFRNRDNRRNKLNDSARDSGSSRDCPLLRSQAKVYARDHS